MVDVLYEGNRTFLDKVANFPEEIYNLEPHTHLHKLLKVILEDPGIGHLRQIQDIARMGQQLGATEFGDLDSFFGEFLRFPRLPTEQYSYDPYRDQLTIGQWDEIERKDALYRERIRMFMQGIMRGGTNEGIAMVAQAATGIPMQVIEVWRASESLGFSVHAAARLGNRKEFVITPKLETGVTTLSPTLQRAIYQVVDRIKPANTICTVEAAGLAMHTLITVRQAISASEYFEIRKYVTGFKVPKFPKVKRKRYFWIKDGVEVEMHCFAHLRHQEHKWSINESVKATRIYRLSSGSYAALEGPQGTEGQQWGLWRPIDRADSPDNFPEGKYAGDQARYDGSGNYVHAWASQTAFVTWLTTQVQALGGQIGESKWRLPISDEPVFALGARPEDALAAPEISVRSTYFGGLQ